MRHETAWLDRKIDRTFIKTDRMVRGVIAVVMIEKYGINLTFHLLFASFLFSSFIFVSFYLLRIITVVTIEYLTIMD